MHHLLTVLLSVLLGAGVLPVAGNDFFSSRVSFRGGRILSSGLVLDGQALTVPDPAPAFEFCINGSVVKATDPCWRYAGVQVKDLSNGGRVFTYEFQGKGKWKGLTLYWDREVFPDVALLRERLKTIEYAVIPGFYGAMPDGSIWNLYADQLTIPEDIDEKREPDQIHIQEEVVQKLEEFDKFPPVKTDELL